MLSLTLFLPLLGALLLAFVPKEQVKAIRFLSLGVTLVTFLLSLGLFKDFSPATFHFQQYLKASWMPSIGINYEIGVDGLSIWLVLLTTLSVPLATFVSFGSIDKRLKDWVFSLLLLEAGMIGAFVALELAIRHGAHDHEPSARDLAELIRLARRQNIKAVFVEHLANPALPAEIARDIGVTLGPPLYSDALSDASGPAATYEAMMRYDTATLVAGMQKN